MAQRRLDRYGWCIVMLGVGFVFARIGGLSSAGYNYPHWQPWTWRPGSLFRTTLTTGGDTGAHVWTPDFVRHHLLGSGRTTGWSKDWYAGFPVLRFYFPAPTWAIVALGAVIPANVAFKLVTVAGVLSLPFSAMWVAHCAQLPRVYRYLFAIGALVFIVDPHFDILGGNILSTLAGEFSFSLSLSASLVFLGLLLRVLRTGRGRAAAAVVLAAVGLSHLLPTIFIGVSSALLILTHFPARRAGRRLLDVLLVGGTAALLGAFWIVPFATHLDYTNDMGWERTTTFVGCLFPPLLRPRVTGAAFSGAVVLVAVVGGVHQLVRFVRAVRRPANQGPDAQARTATLLTLMAAVAALVFRFTPQFRLWNERALPFYFLSMALLAPFGVMAIGSAARRMTRQLRWGGVWPNAPLHALLGTAAVCWWGMGASLGVIPGIMPIPKLDSAGLSVQRSDSSTDRSAVPDWATYNYDGYQSLPDWPEYHALMDTMKSVGATTGCGRAMWDYEDELDRYGTSMGMMLLPYWTGGCIGSMEGLYFESSPTAPYHFINASLLSARPSDPQRGLAYPGLNVVEGVKRLQQWGVKYYMVFSPAAQSQAAVNADLRLIATSPYHRDCSDTEKTTGTCPNVWQIYRVLRSQLVEGLRFQPSVVTGVGQSQTTGWLDLAITQYLHQDLYPTPLTASGPPTWKRVAVTVQTSNPTRTYGDGTFIPSIESQPLPPVTVSAINEGQGEVSFTVDRVGVPVVVKESYFPNWRATGADGPYRLAPNMMVVIPTSRQVTLRFERDGADRWGLLLSLAGAVAVVGLWAGGRRRRVEVARCGDDPSPSTWPPAG